MLPPHKFNMFDQMLQGVQVIDRSYRYLYVNAALVSQSKTTRDELLGKTMPECYPGIEKTALFAEIHDCLTTRLQKEFTNEFTFPDGTSGYFQLKMMPVEEGVLIMSFDISKEKKAEEFLVNAKRQLEEQVKLRTEEILHQKLIIEQQLQYLKVLNDKKDKFFSIVSHDLISPLNSILSLTTMMKSGVTNFTADELENLTERLHKSVMNTLDLAKNLVAWAGSQMKAYNKAEVDSVKISDVLNEVYSLYRELADRKGIRLHCDVDQELRALADRSQISFVVRNLVNNAIKYTRANGVVKIHARQELNKKMMIEVMDNGIGISPEKLTKIRNRSVDESVVGTSGEHGTGLGLLLCYEFIKENGGQIEIESNENTGSKFQIWLNASEFVGPVG